MRNKSFAQTHMRYLVLSNDDTVYKADFFFSNFFFNFFYLTNARYSKSATY